ncbi:MAG: DNA mismatch repair endonuclease MutL [Elusimicrobia bacterium]|nr:DNA mismatch repair endonuclease MutL [Elusimicrobiota bacterium]
MGKVRKLSEEMIRGIAAGEVVERPASVLKELIENAVDAGATRVDVEWREAGRKRLRVSDDGEGMTPEDARLALERHATSKINVLDDLERVGTFGFRGEALPSIMAVSRFELVTRTPGAQEGWAIRAEGSTVTFDGPAGAPVGTSVTADDIFFGVPARLKFLKTDATERSLLFRVVEDASLAAPRVGFRVVSEGKEALSLPAVDDPSRLLERLESLWGTERVNGLKAVDETGRYMSVRGWVSDVNEPQTTARYQRFFVNRRVITNRRLLHALYDGYRGRLLVGRHPAALLFLELDPSLVDVNVHPAKREVRLSHESEAHDFLSRAVQNALSRSVQARAVFAPMGGTETSETISSASPAVGELRDPFVPTKITRFESQSAFNLQAPLNPEDRSPADQWAPGKESFLVDRSPAEGPRGDECPPVEGLRIHVFRSARFEAVAQLYSTYILARLENQFFLFDQHAAAERVLYETLFEQATKESPAKQALLLPWLWEPSPEASEIVRNQKSDFEKLGFGLEPFGGSAWRVVAVPGLLSEGNRARALLEGLVEDLLLGRIPRGWDAFITRAACRGSVKAGDPLTAEEMDRLIKDLQRAPRPWTCPHGRPAFLRFSDQDLAKRFRRI